jgi:hypothetical protein
MASITTQSIAVASAQIASSHLPAHTGQGAEAARQAGIQARLNRARALKNATNASEDKTKSIDQDGRVEGIFADQEISDGDLTESATSGRRLNKTA